MSGTLPKDSIAPKLLISSAVAAELLATEPKRQLYDSHGVVFDRVHLQVRSRGTAAAALPRALPAHPPPAPPPRRRVPPRA